MRVMIEGRLAINVQTGTVELSSAYCHQAGCIFIAVVRIIFQGTEALYLRFSFLQCFHEVLHHLHGQFVLIVGHFHMNEHQTSPLLYLHLAGI